MKKILFILGMILAIASVDARHARSLESSVKHQLNYAHKMVKKHMDELRNQVEKFVESGDGMLRDKMDASKAQVDFWFKRIKDLQEDA